MYLLKPISSAGAIGCFITGSSSTTSWNFHDVGMQRLDRGEPACVRDSVVHVGLAVDGVSRAAQSDWPSQLPQGHQPRLRAHSLLFADAVDGAVGRLLAEFADETFLSIPAVHFLVLTSHAVSRRERAGYGRATGLLAAGRGGRSGFALPLRAVGTTLVRSSSWPAARRGCHVRRSRSVLLSARRRLRLRLIPSWESRLARSSGYLGAGTRK